MPAGRPRQFDPPTALNRAIDVFWSRGYEGASLQELLAATRLSRSSLYQTFGGKHQLFSRCLVCYRESVAAEMIRRLEEAPSGRAFIEQSMRRAVAEQQVPGGPRGCLVLNTANEFGHRDAEVSRHVRAGLSAFRDIFAEAIRRGQADGSVARIHDPDRLAAYLVAAMGGLRTLVKADDSSASINDALELLLAALD
ncbi:TetR/AcrR family transcriptional regulator [Aquisalimonas sp.]|uniref:TetR/AcrR family transcriptional regulator n=1 Tax=Aquisalimonas sp. TaxID=1872621 RepID=UPI0025C62420|nr:TetR/AcrR family transcriptional regulator [Aquisalimonas sp.]